MRLRAANAQVAAAKAVVARTQADLARERELRQRKGMGNYLVTMAESDALEAGIRLKIAENETVADPAARLQENTRLLLDLARCSLARELEVLEVQRAMHRKAVISKEELSIAESRARLAAIKVKLAEAATVPDAPARRLEMARLEVEVCQEQVRLMLNSLDHIQQLHQQRAAANSELEAARLELSIAKTRLMLADLEYAQMQRDKPAGAK